MQTALAKMANRIAHVRVPSFGMSMANAIYLYTPNVTAPQIFVTQLHIYFVTLKKRALAAKMQFMTIQQ